MIATVTVIATGIATVITFRTDLYRCGKRGRQGGAGGAALVLPVWGLFLTLSTPALSENLTKEPALPLAGEAVDRADPRNLKVSVGGEYTSGDYGGVGSTENVYAPLSVKYRGDHGSVQVTVPWTRTDTREAESPEGSIESGVGDVVVSATRYDPFAIEDPDLLLDLTARVEFGTADEQKGLGTGENDYALQLDLYRYSGALMFYGVAGYKFKGEPPGLNLDDTPYAVVGIDRRFSPNTNAGVDLRAQESAYTGNDPLLEAGVYLGTNLSPDVFLLGFVFRGFGDSSPDWGGGFNLAFWY